MIDDRGGYVIEATPAQARREGSILRMLTAAVVLSLTVVIVGLLLLWVADRHDRAARNGRPLPAYTVPATPRPAPGPPATR